MKDQVERDRSLPTPEEQEALTGVLERVYRGPFRRYDEYGRGALGLRRYERVQDVPDYILEQLRRMPYEILTEHAVADFGYLMFTWYENGEPADHCVFLTNGLLEELHPTN